LTCDFWAENEETKMMAIAKAMDSIASGLAVVFGAEV
jgi:hypothetical protein